MPRYEGIKYYCDDNPEIEGWKIVVKKVMPWCLESRALDVGAGNVTISPETKRADIADYPGLNYRCDAAHLQDREGIPLQYKSFDFVFSSHCLEHTENPLVTLKEWCRVAQKYVVFIIPNGDIFKDMSHEEMEKMGHRHNINLNQLWELCQQLIDVASIQEIGYDSEGRGNIYCVLKNHSWE